MAYEPITKSAETGLAALLLAAVLPLLLSSYGAYAQTSSDFIERLTREFKKALEFLPEQIDTSRSSPIFPKEDALSIQFSLNHALEFTQRGVKTTWENSRTGNSGHVAPGARVGGTSKNPCKEYDRSYVTARQSTQYRGKACRVGEGEWKASQEVIISAVPTLAATQSGGQIPKSQTITSAPTTQQTYAGISQPTQSVEPPPGPSREQVQEAQRLLAGLGYNPGLADGLMGPRTRNAIKAFQVNQ